MVETTIRLLGGLGGCIWTSGALPAATFTITVIGTRVIVGHRCAMPSKSLGKHSLHGHKSAKFIKFSPLKVFCYTAGLCTPNQFAPLTHTHVRTYMYIHCMTVGLARCSSNIIQL